MLFCHLVITVCACTFVTCTLIKINQSINHLRQIRPTVQSLTPDGSKTLVQAFISGRLDYCNSLLYGMTDSLFQRLQSVQNAAARLITRTGRREHITPVVRELYTGCLFDAASTSSWPRSCSCSAARPDTTVLVGRLSASPTQVIHHSFIYSVKSS